MALPEINDSLELSIKDNRERLQKSLRAGQLNIVNAVNNSANRIIDSLRVGLLGQEVSVLEPQALVGDEETKDAIENGNRGVISVLESIENVMARQLQEQENLRLQETAAEGAGGTSAEDDKDDKKSKSRFPKIGGFLKLLGPVGIFAGIAAIGTAIAKNPNIIANVIEIGQRIIPTLFGLFGNIVDAIGTVLGDGTGGILKIMEGDIGGGLKQIFFGEDGNGGIFNAIYKLIFDAINTIFGTDIKFDGFANLLKDIQEKLTSWIDSNLPWFLRSKDAQTSGAADRRIEEIDREIRASQARAGRGGQNQEAIDRIAELEAGRALLSTDEGAAQVVRDEAQARIQELEEGIARMEQFGDLTGGELNRLEARKEELENLRSQFGVPLDVTQAGQTQSAANPSGNGSGQAANQASQSASDVNVVVAPTTTSVDNSVRQSASTTIANSPNPSASNHGIARFA